MWVKSISLLNSSKTIGKSFLMGKINMLTVILLVQIFSVEAMNVDSLLAVLDNTIDKRQYYSNKRESKIDSLKNQVTITTDLDVKFMIYQELFKEYRSYNMDSALTVSYERTAIALLLQNEQYIYLSKLNTSEILGVMGMYKESLDIINQINKQKIDKNEWPYYYHLYHSIYSLLAENSLSQREKDYYKKLIRQYKDSLFQVNTPNTFGYEMVKNGKLIESENYDQALVLMTSCYKNYKTDSTKLGVLAYELSNVYEKMQDHEHQKVFLAISAIADLRRAVKGYIALRKLAIILYEEGDVDRAYSYIKCAMEDATFCKARFRTLEISETLPIIVASYEKKKIHEKENIFKYLILISLLSFILFIGVVYIYKQLKKLSLAKKSIDFMNVELKHMNLDLKELNKKLSESNLVKEEYIGSVFNLYSTYIDKLEAYRKNINRKLKTGQVTEALKMSSSTSLLSDELKEFLQNFDAIFLNIYPNFLDHFNNLLIEDGRMYPKSNDILTPEMRIFALIRLGINDSGKIANFLHYSPQTVYNYKLKIKNKLLVSKDEFDKAIHEIGL